MENEEKQKQRLDKNEEIKETGTLNLNGNGHKANIQLLTIIGEIEGHEAVSGNTKATKYEHLIPRLAEVEDDDDTSVQDTMPAFPQTSADAHECSQTRVP